MVRGKTQTSFFNRVLLRVNVKNQISMVSSITTGIESQHFKEKKEQCFEGNIKMVIEIMKKGKKMMKSVQYIHLGHID